MNKKILFLNLSTFSSIGGIQKYNKNIIKALSEIYENIEVVSIYDNTSPYIKNVRFYNFNGKKIKAIFFILKNSSKYDKILVSHINLIPILILIKLIKPSIRIYLCAHGIEVWKKFNPLYKFFLKKFIILPVSSYTLEKMAKLNNLPREIFKILPNCIDVKRFDNKNKKSPFSSIDFNILSVARLASSDRYKGLDTMLKVIYKLNQYIPNVKYTVIGEGEDRQRLEKLAKDLKIYHLVNFKGYVKDLAPYYYYCDIFALPSKGEGFGIVYLEAMSFKKTCLACNEGGQTDFIIDCKNGILCECDNVDCFVDKILNLYRNKDKIKELGINAYNTLIENFVCDKIKEKLKKILK